MGFRNLRLFGTIVGEAWEKFFPIVKYLSCLHVMGTYLVNPVITYGPSMLPTIDMTSCLWLAENISIRSGKVSCGDIVVLRSPEKPMKFIAKRLVAMEGDSVTYTSSLDNSDKPETVVVPKGHVWVLGDNPNNSIDSRNFGPVPYGLLQSRIFWKVWPLKGCGPFWNR